MFSTDTRNFIKEIADEPSPAIDDLPLNLDVPKPSFANAHSRSAFGFQAMAIPDTQDFDMADDIYEGFVDEANKMDENANIVNDEDNGVNGGK
jgi:hypothetical protein